MPDPKSETPWWDRDRHADRRPLLLARNRIQAALRDWFLSEGFVEVDPAALQVSPGNEAHLHAFRTELVGYDEVARPMYLHTSPEFAMKKLLAAGETRIFTFAHVWRNREGGSRHSAEFTMLEWYRAGEDYDRLMADCREILARSGEAAGAELFRVGREGCDPYAEPDRIAVADAFARYAGIDLLATIDAEGRVEAEALGLQLETQGIFYGADESWSDMFSRVLLERVEGRMGEGRPTFLDRYPAPEAALARKAVDDPRVAERFELYACGLELANGFGELTDPVEQRRRFEAEMDLKERLYGERYPIDEDFLAALGAMPPASGCALGFDRLVMLATGAPRIEDVIWVPVRPS